MDLSKNKVDQVLLHIYVWFDSHHYLLLTPLLAPQLTMNSWLIRLQSVQLTPITTS